MFYTKGGNVKSASLDLIWEWIIKAWDSLPQALIEKSFQSCGITNDVTGEEDNLITCFKPGHSCEAGLEILKKKKDDLDEVLLLEQSDPDEDFHNIEEMDLETDDEEVDLD